MEKKWVGLQMDQNVLIISHNFFFAGDCLLFMEDRSNSIQVFREILKRYEDASGCKLIMESLLFSFQIHGFYTND